MMPDDNAGRLATVTDWASRGTQFFYDTDSRLDEIQYPNGTKREFFYDSAGRVERQVDTHIASQTVILEQRYSYDALGRIEDEIVIPEPATYAMTPAIMTYDDDDRISGWQSGAANITPVFDADGNMTSGPLEGVSDSFVYDSRNRLTQAGTATYTYDAEDRRVSKTEGGVSTTYVHDPHAPLSQLLQKTTNGVTTYYVYAAGQLLYEETAGQITVYHADMRGSTLALSDASGAVTNRITYGTYGEIVAATGTLTTPFLYNGTSGIQNDDNGLLHMRARYYSPELRRFINADPIRFAGGMNWYAYAGGDALNFVDPNGFVRWGDLGRATIGMVGNSIGIVVAVGLGGLPEPTGATKVGAAVLGTKSVYGLWANGANFSAALLDQDPLSKGSLANDAAGIIAPGNHNAQYAASILDLGIDLTTGQIAKIAAGPQSLSSGYTLTPSGKIVPLFEGYNPDPTQLGAWATAFQVSSLGISAFDVYSQIALELGFFANGCPQ